MASPSVDTRAPSVAPAPGAGARGPAAAGAGAPGTGWRRRLGFAVRSMGRHAVVTTLVLVLVAGAVAFVALSRAPEYRSSATLVLRGEPVADAATGASPTSGRGGSARSVEQVAQSMEPWLRSSASAVQLVGDLGLAARMDEGEGTLGSARRSVLDLVLGAQSERAVSDAATRRVRDGLHVEVLSGGGIEQTVIVSGRWSRARTAQRIVARAVARWLEDRRSVELSPLEDGVTVAQQALQEANEQVAELRQALGIPEDQDREVPASSPLRTAASIQAAAAQRFGAARVALATAKASFDHRYRLVSGADLPVHPEGSPVPLIALGLVLAYLTAMAVTDRLDRRRGRVVEVWQVTDRLGLVSLGELR